MRKGVITSPLSFQFNEPTGFSIGQGLTEELMRYYLMYWDEVVVPQNNFFGMSTPFLEHALTLGNVYSPTLQLQGKYFDQEIVHAIVSEQVELAALYKKHPTMDWVLHQFNSDNVQLHSAQSSQQDTLRLRLTDALPVPSEDVPFNEILEFKNRRSDELNRLHTVIDDLYLEVLRSPDQTLQTKRAIADLKNAINDLDSVTGERFGFFKKFSTETSFTVNAEKILGYPAIAQAVQAIVNDNIQQAALLDGLSFSLVTALAAASGVASGFECKISRRQVPHSIDNKLHLAYLVNAKNDHIISL